MASTAPAPNDSASTDSLVAAALIPVAAAVGLALLIEGLSRFARRFVFPRDKGNLVVGIHVASAESVHMCWLSSAGEPRPVYLTVENTQEDPSDDCGDDCRIAATVAEGFRQASVSAPVACCATVPGVHNWHGSLTGGAAASIVSVISGVVKAKGIYYDQNDRGMDGSFGGVKVHSRSVALAAACAASYRSSGPRERRASQAVCPHLAIFIGEDETVCAVFTTTWDREGSTCSLNVLSDGYGVPGLEDTQQSDVAVKDWVTTRLKPALSLMIRDADSVQNRLLDFPVAVSGSHLSHPAVVDAFTSNMRLRVWFPHRVAAVQQSTILAFGAAMLALAASPEPSLVFLVDPDCALVPECARLSSQLRIVPRNESRDSDILSSVSTHDGIQPVAALSTSLASHLNATPKVGSVKVGSLRPASVASRASLSKATQSSDVNLSRVGSEYDMPREKTPLLTPVQRFSY